MGANATHERVDWVDYAKGICIILVVMMHSTLGVEKAVGSTSALHAFIEWARPFRMPDFFLISGLFLASRIDRPWRAYLDTKVVHFAYFYFLWMTIAIAVKSPAIAADGGGWGAVPQTWLLSFIDPWSTLWFIYLLAVFFVVAKLTRGLPALYVWLVAAALEIAPIETGWMVIDEFASRFVYFYTGYVLAERVFGFARSLERAHVPVILAALACWAIANAWLVHHGIAFLPGLSLPIGFVGIGAVIAVSVLLARSGWLPAVRYCGVNSIVIYLSFFLFMAASRSVLLKLGLENHPSLVSLVVTAAGVTGPVLLYWAVRGTRLKFLFERPGFFRLKPQAPGARMAPAE
ncbi:MAG: acyltransferase family protein [Parvibaculaceae bacterium]